MFAKSVSLLTLQRAQATINNVNRALCQLQTIQTIQPQPQPNPYAMPTNSFRNHVPPATLTEVIDLTKPSDPKPPKSVSPVENAWKHDLWDQTPPLKNNVANAQPSKPNTSAPKQTVPVSAPQPVPLVPKIISGNPNIRRILSQQNLNVRPLIEPKQNTISPLWLSSGNNTNRVSVFDRLGKKVDETAKESVQSRLRIDPPPETVAKPADTVDFVAMKAAQSTNDIDAIAEKVNF